jgi:enoyl-CoA hydratase
MWRKNEMTADIVTVEVHQAIGTITVRRPKALNALNADVLAELFDAIRRLSADATVRVILLTGEGEKAFIAGADINEFVGAKPPDALAIAARLRLVMDAFASAPKPVIAVINGYCLGGGMELALACDIRIASTTAQLGLPEIKLGIMPGAGGTVRLTKLAGSSVARMLTMIGEPISAGRAHELGLVTSVHEPQDLQSAAAALAERLALLSPFALTQLKSSLNIAVDVHTSAAYDAEIKSFALCFATKDQDEGAKAFLERRKPSFTGE